jgi:hypothetical protein
VESKKYQIPVTDLRRMMIIMFNELKEELKENIQNNSMNIKRIQKKKAQEDTQKN